MTLTRRKPIRRRSKKATAFARELERVTPDLIERADYHCELRLSGVCLDGSPGTTVFVRHHRKRRSQGGTNALVNLLLLDEMGCHRFLHAHPELSILSGWLVHSSDDPSDIAIVRPDYEETADA